MGEVSDWKGNKEGFWDAGTVLFFNLDASEMSMFSL